MNPPLLCLLIRLMVPHTMAKHTCPYCSSEYDDTDKLSKHIDRIHHGSGLLEGDTRKF